MKLPVRRVRLLVALSSILLMALVVLASLNWWQPAISKAFHLNHFAHPVHIASIVFTHSLHTSEQEVSIMPLGDSITYGANSTKYGGYRVWLWQESVAAGWKIRFVGSQSSGPASLPDKANEGHPGWRIDQLSAHITGWLDTYQPQIILLHIGTNDIIQGYSVATAIARLNTLVDQITTIEPDTTLIVAQITPLGDPTLNAKVRLYNHDLLALIQRKKAIGKHIIVVDMYDAVPLSDITDHIHPNDAGYKLMAHVWYNALAQLFTATPTPAISLHNSQHVS
jgi:lysophospholipase L1-like esterase